jgi:hypothetical protein
MPDFPILGGWRAIPVALWYVLAGAISPVHAAGNDAIQSASAGDQQAWIVLAQAAVQTAPTPEELAKQREVFDAALKKAGILSRDLDGALLRLRKLNGEWNALSVKLTKSKGKKK